MAERKRVRQNGTKDDELEGVQLSQIPPGTTLAPDNSLNIKLAGGVTSVGGENAKRAIDARKADELVEIPFLKHTLMDPVRGRIFPTTEPVMVSYASAVTFGLLPKEPQENTQGA